MKTDTTCTSRIVLMHVSAGVKNTRDLAGVVLLRISKRKGYLSQNGQIDPIRVSML
jgi:hypothetical protein